MSAEILIQRTEHAKMHASQPYPLLSYRLGQEQGTEMGAEGLGDVCLGMYCHQAEVSAPPPSQFGTKN